MEQKDLGITEVRKAKENISDLQVYGNGDTFALLCKASSQSQGWMKSAKVCNVDDGCVVQVTTQQRNPDGSYAVAEALTYVPHVNIDLESNPRKLVTTYKNVPVSLSCGEPDREWEKQRKRESYLHLLIEAQRSGASVSHLIEDELMKIKSELN